jgi:hypothetical protein
MPIELKTKSGNISLTAPKTSGATVDLSNYYTKTQTEERFVSREDWENTIPAFLTEIPSEYVTESELDEKGYLTEHQDLSNYATTVYVQTAINENAPDLSGYAKKTDIPDVPDVSAFQTEEQVNTLISNALNAIGVAEQGAY